METQKCSMTINAALCLAGLLAASGATAQIKRTEVLRTDATTPNHELVVVNGELAAGGHKAATPARATKSATSPTAKSNWRSMASPRNG